MADWYGAARTNYFPVRDVDAFKAWAAGASLRPHQSETSDLWCVCSGDHSGAWPSAVWDDEAREDRDFDIVEELARHVQEGWPVVLMESRAEKLRYITGVAVAFRVTGADIEREDVSLEDIYALAEERWGIAPTRCAY